MDPLDTWLERYRNQPLTDKELRAAACDYRHGRLIAEIMRLRQENAGLLTALTRFMDAATRTEPASPAASPRRRIG